MIMVEEIEKKLAELKVLRDKYLAELNGILGSISTLESLLKPKEAPKPETPAN